MPFKKDASGNIVIGTTGHPVFVYPGGDEVDFDPDQQVVKIRELTTKSTKRKETIEGLNKVIGKFSGVVDINDPESIDTFLASAAENATKVKNFNDKDLLKAEDVEKIKAGVRTEYEQKLENQKTSYEGKLEKAKETLSSKDEAIARSVIKGAFARSKFVRDKTSYPTADIAFKDLYSKFGVEEKSGEHVGFGLDSEGNKLYSLKSPTEHADIDEAIEIVINTHPQREQLLLVDGGGTGGDTSKKKQTISGQKVIAKNDREGFGRNVEDIASGKVRVEG